MATDPRGWIGVKVYYADGRVLSSADVAWSEMPDQGVQVVVVYYDPPYRVMHDGVDEYRIPGEDSPKFGAWVDTDLFYEIQARAFRDEVF